MITLEHLKAALKDYTDAIEFVKGETSHWNIGNFLCINSLEYGICGYMSNKFRYKPTHTFDFIVSSGVVLNGDLYGNRKWITYTALQFSFEQQRTLTALTTRKEVLQTLINNFK